MHLNEKEIKNYTLVLKEELKDIASVAYVYEHNKTGAKVTVISNDDKNKSFIIGFRTPQNDATGVPHILEHTVLCGSDKYPVKDAMTEVGKGSLNTFMNAFTYPDRTLFPVASCNDKDFQNLVGVYMDAVFFPRVLKEKKIFMQEGWHYELPDLDSEITINGVVYNEMKGAYSSADSLLSSYIMFSLFPDTQYGVESGGDPDVIPTLKYEDFCAFHRRLYHPSNARVYLYGDVDFKEKLEFFDREYFSKFEKISPDSAVKLQTAFDERRFIEKEYSVSKDEEDAGTYLSYNVCCSDYTDAMMTEVINSINYALCGVNGAKLKENLIDSGICKDAYSDFSTDTSQKYFSIIAEECKPEDRDKFVSIVEDTIREVISEGFDKKALEASITNAEFNYREADFGRFPKGIAYGMMVFDRWTYSDESIFSDLKLNDMFDKLRSGIGSGLFEKVLKERILENEHKTVLVMKPHVDLDTDKAKHLEEDLKKLKESLSEEELLKIVNETKALKEYQDAPDSDEAKATIPTLKLSDVNKEGDKCEYTLLDGPVPEIYTKINGNGILYVTLSFDMSALPERLHEPFSILKLLFGELDTKSYKYNDLVNEMNIKSGSTTYMANVYVKNLDIDDYGINFDIKSKVLYKDIPDFLKLLKEVLLNSKLTDKDRIRKSLETTKLSLESTIGQAGYVLALEAASRLSSGAYVLRSRFGGVDRYRSICNILKNFDECFDKLSKDMEEALRHVLTKENLQVFVCSDDEGRELLNKELPDFIDALYTGTDKEKFPYIQADKELKAYSASSMVAYNVISGNFKKTGNLPYTGSLLVLKNILNSDYLWNTVRLQGGAYGCVASIIPTGDTSIFSYRDPGIKKTIEAYRNIPNYIKNLDLRKGEIERYIISAIGELDTCMTPKLIATRTITNYRSGITNEFRAKEREELLNTSLEDLRSLAKYFEAVLSTEFYSTFAGNDLLSKEGEMFKNIEPAIV